MPETDIAHLCRQMSAASAAAPEIPGDRCLSQITGQCGRSLGLVSDPVNVELSRHE